MQLILKDGYIYLVKNKILANNNIEADVITKYVDNFENKRFSYSFNDGPFHPIKDEKIIIKREDIKKPYLDLRIKAGDEIFKSDRLPLTYSLVIGAPVEEVYEQTLNAIFKQLTTVNEDLALEKSALQNQIDALRERIKNLEEVGELI
jgi:hypothetical protein